MKKIVLIFIASLFWLGCSGVPEDPYLNLDPDFPIEIRSLVVPDIYDLLSDRTRFWGSPYFMDQLELREGGNSGELTVSFTGGCAFHRWTLYGNSIYDDRQNPDEPLDITLYLFHGQERDDCSANQSYTFRTMDLSFLTPGLYNITIENVSNRNQFIFSSYEIR